ncbi:MAG: sigma-70 family RNA polymerase sigma factor [Clostridia bacterium]|nr:sigma-70 family RNA polymerase sigma factor [Clostridia bacterium]
MSEAQRYGQINEYLKRMQDGDTAALAPLYDCTSKHLYALCYTYFQNRPDSEDAVSETYLRVQMSIASFKGSDGYAWMSTIARNICINMLKKNSHTVSVDMEDEAAVSAFGIECTEAPPAVEESEIMTVARTVLNENEFRILILHAVNREKFKHIASTVNKPEATVRWQYHNAIQKVKKEYERRAKL